MKSLIKTAYFPFFLVFYEVVIYLSNDMYLPAMPDMMKDLQVSMQQIQLTVTTWLVGSTILPLVIGVVSDRYGRRTVLLTGGFIFIFSTLLCAISHSLPVLLWGRFIQGASLPTLLVAGYATIHELFDQKQAIKLLALMGSITVLAPALGPLLGGMIITFSSWRIIFWFLAACATIAIIFLSYVMPETISHQKNKSFKEMCKQYMHILNMKFILLSCALGFLFTGFIMWITAGSLLVIDSFGYSSLGYGLIQAFVFGFFILGNRLVNFLIENMQVNNVVWTGLFIGATGGLLLATLSIFLPNNLPAFIVSLAIFAIGTGLCFAPLNRLIIETSNEPMGMRVALFTVSWELFAVLGSLIASYGFNGSVASLAHPMACTAILALTMYFLSTQIKAHK